MIVAIMQPYFFPYIGYFQLMKAVDRFVFYDDAQFMKGGWVNRNRILRDGAPAWWTYPVERDDYRLPICQRHYGRSATRVQSMLGQIEGAYRRAPRFRQVLPQLAACFESGETSISRFNQAHLQSLARDLGIDCDFLVSSEMAQTAGLSGQARVIDLCRRLGATRFINPIGGLGLYDATAFHAAGIELAFLRAEATTYPQFQSAHVPFLSIVDVLMFNPADVVRDLLQGCRMVAPVPAGAGA